ncbi:hypothetical protein RZ63_08270 [[Haemophilus] ducreyi]|uniref:VaFE repeat-containing surface-anchored protein n=1 Tax=Haemophilus ducreyi TaxID=730 RepID=UPI000655799E|nr:hypothetical protein RZ63_08270 [[Haemophilus] ducreyi]
MAIEEDVVVTDHVHFKDLVPGKEYILNAELRNKDDESVIGKSKEPVKFTPKSSEGDLKDVNDGHGVEIVVNEGVKAGSVDKAVAFEYLTSAEVDKNGKETPDATEENPNEIAKHDNINDEAQTVESHEKLTPEIGTTVEKLGENVAIEEDVVVTDHVHFKDLVPGKEYILNAELRNKESRLTLMKRLVSLLLKPWKKLVKKGLLRLKMVQV